MDFFGYLKARYFGEPYDISGSQYLKELDEAVETAKLDEEKERAYMSWTMKLRDAQEEARKEGIEQGIKQGKEQEKQAQLNKFIRQMLLSGISFEMMCTLVQEPANTVQAIVDRIKAEQTTL